MSAHRAIISTTCNTLFSTFPSLSSTTESACIVLPDWTGEQVEGALNSLYGLHDPSQLEIILGLASHESHHVTQEYEQERVDKIKCENTNKNKYENSSKITGENSSKVECENMSKIDCEEVFISEGGLD